MKARIIYALHMILPTSFFAWHLSRLDPNTLEELRRLFA